MSSFEWVHEDGTLYQQIIFPRQDRMNDLPYKDVFRRMMMLTPDDRTWRIHTFIYGIFATHTLRRLLRRPIPKCRAGDRVMMAELALFTHFCTVEQIYFHKTFYKKSLGERYKDEDLGQQWLHPLSRERYYWTMIWRLLTSRNISLWSKVVHVVPALYQSVRDFVAERSRDRAKQKRVAQKAAAQKGSALHAAARGEGESRPCPAPVSRGPLHLNIDLDTLPEDFRAALLEFDEAFYLESNPDVREAVADGGFESAVAHFFYAGFREGRLYRRNVDRPHPGSPCQAETQR
jgi:hypothetical protein